MKTVPSVWTMQWLQRPWEQAVNTAIFSLQGGPYLKLLTFLFLKTRHFCRQHTLLTDSTEPTQTSCICLCKHTHWSQRGHWILELLKFPAGTGSLNSWAISQSPEVTLRQFPPRPPDWKSPWAVRWNTIIDLFPTPHSIFGSWQKYKLCLCFVNFPVFY